MSTNNAEGIISSIDTFICAQVPAASEVIFAYEPTHDATIAPYKVTVVAIYDNHNVDAIVTRPELHNSGVEKMEEYLGSTLPVVLASPYVQNFVLGDGVGKFGVALSNSEDRRERIVKQDYEEQTSGYYED